MAITSDGRTTGYFVSTQEFAELQRLRALERRVCGIAELPQSLADAIAEAKMAPGNEHLNALLDD